jgi:hypothetical protein
MDRHHGRTTMTVTTHRPTATRTALGLLVGGIPGGLIGFAARKKERQRIEIKNIKNI